MTVFGGLLGCIDQHYVFKLWRLLLGTLRAVCLGRLGSFFLRRLRLRPELFLLLPEILCVVLLHLFVFFLPLLLSQLLFLLLCQLLLTGCIFSLRSLFGAVQLRLFLILGWRRSTGLGIRCIGLMRSGRLLLLLLLLGLLLLLLFVFIFIGFFHLSEVLFVVLFHLLVLLLPLLLGQLLLLLCVSQRGVACRWGLLLLVFHLSGQSLVHFLILLYS